MKSLTHSALGWHFTVFGENVKILNPNVLKTKKYRKIWEMQLGQTSVTCVGLSVGGFERAEGESGPL